MAASLSLGVRGALRVSHVETRVSRCGTHRKRCRRARQGRRASLDALEPAPLSLAELVGRRPGCSRATAHRLAVALEAHGLVRRDPDGRFALGLRLVGLGRGGRRRHRPGARRPGRCSSGCATTRARACSCTCATAIGGCASQSLESPHGLRTIVPVGAVLPLDKGSAGRCCRPTPLTCCRGQPLDPRRPHPGPLRHRIGTESAPHVVGERGGAGGGGGLGERAGRPRRADPRRRQRLGTLRAPEHVAREALRRPRRPGRRGPRTGRRPPPLIESESADSFRSGPTRAHIPSDDATHRRPPLAARPRPRGRAAPHSLLDQPTPSPRPRADGTRPARGGARRRRRPVAEARRGRTPTTSSRRWRSTPTRPRPSPSWCTAGRSRPTTPTPGSAAPVSTPAASGSARRPSSRRIGGSARPSGSSTVR